MSIFTLFVLVFQLHIVSASESCLFQFFRERSPVPSLIHIDKNRELTFLSRDRKTKTTVKRFNDRGFVVDFIKQTIFLEDQSSTLKPLPQSAIREFSEDITTLIKINYPRRGWAKDFIDKVSKNIESNFMSSDFIIIRDPITNEPISSMRLLIAPYLFRMSGAREDAITSLNGDSKLATLPVESLFLEGSIVRQELNTLKIALEVNAKGSAEVKIQILFEVSSLVIAHKHPERDTLVALLYKYFLISAQHPTVLVPNVNNYEQQGVSLYSLLLNNPSAQLLYAYGDRIGKLLYLPYGFAPVKGIPAKELMGTSWETLVSSDDMFAKVRKRYDLGFFAGEAIALFKTTFPDYSLMNSQYWQKEPYDTYVEETFTRRQNKIIGGPTPQYKEFLKNFPFGPRTYQLED